jgi:hypothetical protein
MRKEVKEFAEAMEEQLKKNDWKMGWNACSDLYLQEKIVDKFHKLRRELEEDLDAEDTCIDLGNYIMMLYDNIRIRKEYNARKTKDNKV